MTAPIIRPAIANDLPRIHEIRHGTAENRLSDPSKVTDAEVRWYMNEAIFLVSEDEAGVVQGFTCANHQTGCIWALFVIDGQHGKGHGSSLIMAAIGRLAAAGHRQSFLTTDKETRAEAFYLAKGWTQMGASFDGSIVFRKSI
jgi:GNAT superfamily N-acetyltransferase